MVGDIHIVSDDPFFVVCRQKRCVYLPPRKRGRFELEEMDQLGYQEVLDTGARSISIEFLSNIWYWGRAIHSVTLSYHNVSKKSGC